jgi:ribosomal protein S27E
MTEKGNVKRPKTFFLKVKCVGCGNEQTVFSAASRTVHCLACNQILAESGPSKIIPKGKIVKEMR